MNNSVFNRKVAGWRELPRQTQPFKTSAEKYIPSDINIISVHWRKEIYSVYTEEPTKRLTECVCSDQEERRRDKRSVTDGISRRATIKWLTVHQFDTCRSRSQD